MKQSFLRDGLSRLSAAYQALSPAEKIKERLAQIQQRRNLKTQDGNPVPASLVASAKAASWIAYFCLVYFLWIYTLDIARDRAAAMHLTHAGTWVAEKNGVEFWFPLVIGFGVISIGIPYVAKIAIPTFMALDWRANVWPKAWALFIAVSVSLVVFAGTFTIQGDAILEKGRESSVEVAKVEQGAAVLQAKIASKEAELKTMMDNHNAYLAQAASVGAAEWQRSYIDKTPANDPQRDRIVRALGAARAADAVRANLDALRVQAASQTTVAAVAEHPAATAGTSWISGAIDYIQGIRAVLLSLVMDIVALLMPWIALRLEQARARGLGASYDNTIAIEDHSQEDRLEVQPYTQPSEKREQFYDEEGNRIVRRRATFAKVPLRKGGKRKDSVTGKAVRDETLYEPPAKHSVVNAAYPDEMETVKVEEPETDEAPEDSTPQDSASSPKAVSEMVESAGDDDLRLTGNDTGFITAAKPSLFTEDDSADAAKSISNLATPPLLDDALVDEMIERGLAQEDADGFITPATPDVMQVDDEAPRYPQLPKPNGPLEHMQ